MPPKKKKAVVEEPPRVPRDLAEANPLDGRDGALGVDSLEMHERVREVQEDLVAFKIADAIGRGCLELDLRDAGLHALPDAAFDVPGLAVLDASRNALTNDVFTDLADLPDLRAVNLSGNLLATVLPDAVGRLPRGLEEVCLDDNVVSALPPSAAEWAALAWLSVRHNVLTGIPGELFAAWRALRYLDLRENKLAALPEEVGDCAALTDLLLSRNALPALPDGLGRCAALTTLTVSNNALTALPASLGGCVSLEVLEAASNAIADVPGAVFAGARRLRELYLGGNKLAALPDEVGLCVELEVLAVASNAIKTLPDSIGALTALREVYAGNNPMTGLPPTVVGWASLAQGVFRNCKLKALPPGVETAWAGARVLDLRAKGKKDTCKVSTEVQAALKKTRVVGAVWTKPKKAKGKK